MSTLRLKLSFWPPASVTMRVVVRRRAQELIASNPAPYPVVPLRADDGARLYFEDSTWVRLRFSATGMLLHLRNRGQSPRRGGLDEAVRPIIDYNRAMNFLERLVQRYPDLSESLPAVSRSAELLQACFQSGGKLLVCGNGGSAADSEHIVGELMKGYNLKRPLPPEMRARLVENSPGQGAYLADHLQGALPAISLVSQTSLITAFINDVAADMIFAQQVYGYGRPGDVLLGITCSGNAPDVLNALRVARTLGVKTLGLTGRSGGGMLPLCDVLVRVALDAVPDIQERHLAIYHALCAHLEASFFPQ